MWPLPSQEPSEEVADILFGVSDFTCGAIGHGRAGVRGEGLVTGPLAVNVGPGSRAATAGMRDTVQHDHTLKREVPGLSRNRFDIQRMVKVGDAAIIATQFLSVQPVEQMVGDRNWKARLYVCCGHDIVQIEMAYFTPEMTIGFGILRVCIAIKCFYGNIPRCSLSVSVLVYNIPVFVYAPDQRPRIETISLSFLLSRKRFLQTAKGKASQKQRNPEQDQSQNLKHNSLPSTARSARQGRRVVPTL